MYSAIIISLIGSDDSLTKEELPQVGFYCHRFNKNGDVKSKVSSSSIQPLKKDAAYVPLRCNSDGTFTLFNEGRNSTEAVDVNKVYCSKKGLYPVLKKSQDGDTPCSEVGVDGRRYDVLTKVRYVEIGWNMSAMKFSSEKRFAPTEIKDMVSLTLILH